MLWLGRIPLALIGVTMILGLVIRLRGVTWGLPYLYDPDEHFLVDPAVRFVVSGDLNPHWFVYPASTIMYVLGLVYFVYWAVGFIAGWFPDLRSFAALFATDPTTFYLIGRVVAIVLAVLTIPLTYALCRRMAGKGAAVTAALIVAVSPLHADFSRIVRTDPLMTVFILTAMLLAVKAIDRQPGRNLFFSGVFVGLATATKFPGISGAMIVVGAALLARAPDPVTWKRRGQWVVLALLGGFLGFFGAAPFVVTGVREVYWSLVVEGSHSHLSATGGRGLPNYLWYLTGPLKEAVGWPLELAALVGFAASCKLRHRPRLILASFTLLFLLGIGLSLKRWDRWIVPLTPCVAILAAIGLESLVRIMWRGRRHSVFQDVVIAALGVLLLTPSATEALRRGGTTADTRNIAKAWVEGHVPPGSKIAVEQYTPPVSREAYEVFVVLRGELQRDATTRGFKGALGDMRTLEALREQAIDYVLLSSYVDRYRAERRSYPAEVRFYEELFEASDLLYELRPTGYTKGPVIRVLKLRH